MKRILQSVCVLLVCLLTFMTVGCVRMNYTYSARYVVAPLVRQGEIREGEYSLLDMSSFLADFAADEEYYQALAGDVSAKIGDAKGIYPTLETRIRFCLGVEFTEAENDYIVTVSVSVGLDKDFRDALKEAVKTHSAEYIIKHMPYPDDCIGTYCEFKDESSGNRLNINFGA